MNISKDHEYNLKEISPLTLAFLGDGVFDILVREYLVSNNKSNVGVLNNLKVSYVCAKSQAKAIDYILEDLTEEEIAVFKRGRNAKVSSVPKSSSVAEYHKATGLEALFGYVYLKGDCKRLNQIFNLCIKCYLESWIWG